MATGVFLRYIDDEDQTPCIGWGKKEDVERDHALLGLQGQYVYIGDVDPSTKSWWPPNLPYKEEDLRCFKIENNQVVLCPIKARKFHMDRVRSERDFSSLDLEFMMALENGQDTSIIKAKKQRLRDIMNDPSWDLCVTLQDFQNMSISKILATTNQ